jgi:pyruvate decarboxylase
MGKGVLDEHHPLFSGCYAGSNSLPAVINEVEAADLVIYVGSLRSDFNSGGFSVHLSTARTIKLHSWTTNVGYASFPTTDIRHVLPALVSSFATASKSIHRDPTEGKTMEEKMAAGLVSPLIRGPDHEGAEIVHAWMWGRLAAWFKDNGKSSRARVASRQSDV